jgi:adenylyltransferase/sulfurtransferase
MDLVIGCLDSLDARLALNRACMRTQTPWLNGAIEVTVAEVSLFRYGAGACFECGMSATMWERRSQRFSCGGLRATGPEARMPTTAVVASLAASYLVQEALYLLHAGRATEKEGLAYSAKVTLNLKPYETAVFALGQNPDCLAHEALEPIEMRSEAPDAVSVVDLLGWADSPGGIVELGFDLVTEMRCADCGACEPVRSPLGRCDDSLMRCPECGADSRSPDSVSWLDAEHPLSRTALSDLGVPDHQILCVNHAGVRRYYQLGGRPVWDGWRPRTKAECLV